MTNTRECGPCRACCKAVGVVELDKREGVWCEHVDAKARCGSCAIYDTRPQACRDFECAWLQDSEGQVFHVEQRPDRMHGCVVSVYPVPQAIHPLGEVLVLHEGYDGARLQPKVRDMMATLLDRGFVIVAVAPGRILERVFYPDGTEQHRTPTPWETECEARSGGEPMPGLPWQAWRYTREKMPAVLVRDIERVGRQNASAIRERFDRAADDFGMDPGFREDWGAPAAPEGGASVPRTDAP